MKIFTTSFSLKSSRISFPSTRRSILAAPAHACYSLTYVNQPNYTVIRNVLKLWNHSIQSMYKNTLKKVGLLLWHIR